MGDIRLNNDLFRNPNLISLMRGGELLLYCYLRTNIVRGPMTHPCARYVYDNHFLNKELAVSYGYRRLGVALGMGRNTVKKYANELKDAGVIKIKAMKPKLVKKYRPQTIFVLGKWYENPNPVNNDTNYEEFYFIDDVFKDKGLFGVGLTGTHT